MPSNDNKVSDTPRVDAEEQWAEWNGDEFKGVHSSFARELERELNAANAKLATATNDALEEAAKACDFEESRRKEMEKHILKHGGGGMGEKNRSTP